MPLITSYEFLLWVKHAPACPQSEAGLKRVAVLPKMRMLPLPRCPSRGLVVPLRGNSVEPGLPVTPGNASYPPRKVILKLPSRSHRLVEFRGRVWGLGDVS